MGSWVHALKHKNPNTTKCSAKNSNRSCSLHFVDGTPTKTNPLSIMRLSYNTKPQRSDPSLKHSLAAKKTQSEEDEISVSNYKVNLFSNSVF